jgi:hypothetical protein
VSMTKKIKIIIGIITALVLFRAFLPLMIKNYLNDYMEHKIEGYTGHIENFDLSLYRGAYQLEDFSFKKKDGNKDIPFISIKSADISVSWKALFQGRILANLYIREPRIDFLDSKNKSKRQFGNEEKTSNWIDVYQKIVPFSLETLKVKDGEIHFQNKESKFPVDIFLNKVQLEAKNIHNTNKDNKQLFSTYKVEAKVQNQAIAVSYGSFNILNKPMAFDFNFKMEKLKLTQLNKFFLYYGPFDLTSGTLSLYTEVASKKYRVKGYVKPVFENVDVISGKENINTLKRFGFEFGTAVLNLFFRDGKTLDVAAKIPIEGDIRKPKFGFWSGFKSAVNNAFGSKKVEKKIDNTINLKSVDQPKEKKK